MVGIRSMYNLHGMQPWKLTEIVSLLFPKKNLALWLYGTRLRP